MLLFQLHDHIAREILHEDPRNTNYYGQRAVGDFLRTLLAERPQDRFATHEKARAALVLLLLPLLRAEGEPNARDWLASRT